MTVLNRLDHIFSLKNKQTTALKAFVDKKVVFTVLLTGFDKSLISAQRYVTDFVTLIGCKSIPIASRGILVCVC